MKIPEGWRKVAISEIADVKTGTTPLTSDINNYGDFIPFVSPADLGEFKYIHKSEKHLSKKGSEKARIIPKGSTLFTCIGSTIGKVGLAGLNLTTNQQINAVIPSNEANSEYLFYSLSRIAPKIKRIAGVQAVPIINKTEFESFVVPLPPLPEQKAIADILSTWDEAIEKTEKLIKEKEKEKEHLIYEIIIEPALSRKWNEQPAGKLFKERRESNCNDLNLLSITGNEGVIPRDEINRKDSSNEDKSKYLRICSGDIGYNTMRMWQGVSALSELEGIVSPAYTIVTPKKDLHPKFVAYLFKTPFMIHRFYRYSQGLTSDTWNLKFHHFAEVKIPFPPLSEQKSIAETLNTAQDEINILKKLSEKYKKQKQGLMQKLLTGEWRVRNV